VVYDGSLRGRGDEFSAESLGLTRVGGETLLDLFKRRRWLFCELDRDAGHMTIDDGYSVTAGRDLEGLGSVVIEPLLVVRDTSQDLGSFPLDLFLFPTDVWYDVVDDVHRGNTGVSGTGDGLHRGAHDGFQRPKLVFQGFQSNDHSSGGTIGVADNVSLL
jgi:hypothetical protein